MAPVVSLILAAGVVFNSSEVEELRLPADNIEVRVDPWRARVTVTGSTSAPLRRALASSRLCPTIRAEAGQLVMSCVDGRVAARVRRARGATVLELRRARGVPTATSNLVGLNYPPEHFGLGGPCPGTTDAGRAECALARGELAEAAALLETALTSPDAPHAHVRLGDLALLTRDDTVHAIEHYRAAGTRGPFGRLAALRLCDLIGCDDLATAVDPVALPEPMKTEFELSVIRRQALEGRAADATDALLRRVHLENRPAPCPLWPQVCAGVVAAALSADSSDARGPALALFLEVRADLGQPDVILTRQAADAAEALGAPRFAANLLASISQSVSRERLQVHLRRVASLYEQAGDAVRAQIVRDYALTKRRGGTAPKNTAPPPSNELNDLVARAARDVDVANAMTLTSRSRTAPLP